MESEIVIREYRTSDAKDLFENEYPFIDIYEWGTWFKDLKKKIISFFGRRQRKRFVAYSLKEKKAVGMYYLENTTKNLWYNTGLFVIPSYRRRGIAKLLDAHALNYMKGMGGKKIVGFIEVTNFPSITFAAKKIGRRFLPQSYYECGGDIQEYLGINEIEGDDKIALENFSRLDLEILYRIYQECVSEEWRTFLEIDKDNFLERFIRYIYRGGIFKPWFRKRVVIVRTSNGEIIGYFYYKERLLPINKLTRVTVYLFLLPHAHTAINFIGKLFNRLRSEGYEQASLIFTNKNRIFMEEIADTLQNNFKFKTTKYLLACWSSVQEKV